MIRPGSGRSPCRRPTWAAQLLLLGAPLLLAGRGASQPLDEDFGRWERSLRHCRIVITTSGSPEMTPAGCRLVRLDQQLAGLLTVRFLQPSRNSLFRERQLVFAGVLAEGSPAMGCDAGSCEPRWPLRLRVSAVGEAGLDATGTASGLTRARIAAGNCSLEARLLRCEASVPEGRHWSVEAAP